MAKRTGKDECLRDRENYGASATRVSFLLVDRVESYVANSNLIAVKNVTASENTLKATFRKPIMPGVL